MLTEFQTRLSHYRLNRPEPTQYTQFIDRKRAWSAPYECNPDANPDPSEHETVQKCLALAMALEIPVGDLVLDGLHLKRNYRKLPSDVEYALIHNANDEATHYEAFSVAYKGHQVESTPFDSDMAALLHGLPVGYHPVYLAGYLELGVFMVTLSMLRRYGSSPVQTLVADVSRDESTHVLTNWALTDEYSLGTEGDRLRKWRHDVMTWLTSSLPNEGKYTPSFWLEQSDSLINKRRADGLEFTKAAIVPAFFETSAKQRGAYAKTKKG